METDTKFFLHLVAMENHGGLPKNSKEVNKKRMQAKACGRTEQPVVYRTLANLRRMSFTNSIYLQIDHVQLRSVYCNRRVV